jgi:hypothetical protein
MGRPRFYDADHISRRFDCILSRFRVGACSADYDGHNLHSRSDRVVCPAQGGGEGLRESEGQLLRNGETRWLSTANGSYLIHATTIEAICAITGLQNLGVR